MHGSGGEAVPRHAAPPAARASIAAALLVVLLVAGAAAHGTMTRPVWESGPIPTGGSWSRVFHNGSTYHDGFSDAAGQVSAGDGPAQATVEIGDGFQPERVVVAAGGQVTWRNTDDRLRSVISDEVEEYEDGHEEQTPAGMLALPGIAAALLVRRR